MANSGEETKKNAVSDQNEAKAAAVREVLGKVTALREHFASLQVKRLIERNRGGLAKDLDDARTAELLAGIEYYVHVLVRPQAVPPSGHQPGTDVSPAPSPAGTSPTGQTATANYNCPHCAKPMTVTYSGP